MIISGVKAPDGTPVKLEPSGTIEAEHDFLVREADVGVWSGQRIALNAMLAGQLVLFVERKPSEAGLAKLVPRGEAQAVAYSRTWRIAAAQDAVDQALALAAGAPPGVPPVGLERQIAGAIEGTGKSWDEALWDTVHARRAEVGGGIPI